MRAPLLLIALALTACQNAAADTDITNSAGWNEAEQQFYARQVHNGVSPEEVKASLADSRRLTRELAADAETNYHVRQKQQETEELRADQCRREPYLSGC